MYVYVCVRLYIFDDLVSYLISLNHKLNQSPFFRRDNDTIQLCELVALDASITSVRLADADSPDGACAIQKSTSYLDIWRL